MLGFRKTEAGTSGSCGAGSRRRNVWWWIEHLFLASGVALLVIWGAARMEGVLGSRAALKQLAVLDRPAAVPELPSDESAAPQALEASELDFHLWSEGRVQAFRNSAPAMAGAPLAVLRIAKINLAVPVLEGTDDRTLNHAVGRIAGTARPGEPGNIGIAGHRDSFFRGLKNVRIGDAVELQTRTRTDVYVIDRIQIVTPDRVEVLESGPAPSLTLVTCYPFYVFGSAPQRYIVRASLVENEHAREDMTGSHPDQANTTEMPQP